MIKRNLDTLMYTTNCSKKKYFLLVMLLPIVKILISRLQLWTCSALNLENVNNLDLSIFYLSDFCEKNSWNFGFFLISTFIRDGIDNDISQNNKLTWARQYMYQPLEVLNICSSFLHDSHLITSPRIWLWTVTYLGVW